MRKLVVALYVLLSWLLIAPCFATFTGVQQPRSNAKCGGATGTTCGIDITSTGTGHLLVAMLGLSGGTITSGSGGGTWVHPTGCISAGIMDFMYVLSSTSGTTTVNFTITTSNAGRDLWFYELSFTASSVAFANCNIGAPGSATTLPGVAITTGGANYFIAQGINLAGAGTYSSIDGTYTRIAGSSAGREGAWVKDVRVGTAPTWTLTGGSSSGKTTAIGFYEVGGSNLKVKTAQRWVYDPWSFLSKLFGDLFV